MNKEPSTTLHAIRSREWRRKRKEMIENGTYPQDLLQKQIKASRERQKRFRVKHNKNISAKTKRLQSLPGYGQNTLTITKGEHVISFD
jgi:hypothetical protein